MVLLFKVNIESYSNALSTTELPKPGKRTAPIPGRRTPPTGGNCPVEEAEGCCDAWVLAIVGLEVDLSAAAGVFSDSTGVTSVVCSVLRDGNIVLRCCVKLWLSNKKKYFWIEQFSRSTSPLHTVISL